MTTDTLHFHTVLPDAPSGVPDWVHLLPAGQFAGADGRGPYTVADADAVITHSMAPGRLPIDENHAIDRAATTGGPAPAVGWIVAMQARQDGIWGRVEWTPDGRALVEGRAYRGISPAFFAPNGRVTQVARASLTNLPNLQLASLHNQGNRMDLADIRRRLGLPETATDADVAAALDRSRDALSLHTRAAEIAGLGGDASSDAIVTGLRARTAGAEMHAQQTITDLTTQVGALQAQVSAAAADRMLRDAADGGAVISDEVRAELISLHSTNPAMAEKIVKGLPRIEKGIELHTGKPGSPDDELLKQAAAAWGQSPDDVRAAMKGTA
ncbi:MAG: phage protease [Gluconacetobacter sp.]